MSRNPVAKVTSDEAEFSVLRKRTGSPSLSPAKKSKKQKTGVLAFKS